MSGIYITAPERDTGKSVIALGVLHLMTTMVSRVGVFRPITRAGESRDYILELLLAHATADLSYDDCVGVSYQQLHQDADAAIGDIIDRFHGVAARCDAVVIVGSDYTDVAEGLVPELSVNARIAVNLGAPVVLSVRAKGRTPDEVARVVEACLGELADRHAPTVAVFANRCAPGDVAALSATLQHFEPQTHVLPDEPLLAAPSVSDMQQVVNGRLISGDPALMEREVMGVVVAGMIAEHVLERLSDGDAVIAPGDRSDVVLAVAGAHAAEGFPSPSCLILNGGIQLHPAIADLVSSLDMRLPIIATATATFETTSAAASARGRITVTSQDKVDTALALMERNLDVAELSDWLATPSRTVTTPQMFTHHVQERARSDRKHIVLPEGDDDRILRAAGKLLQRQVADLTVLGSEDKIRSRASELGVDLSRVNVLDPSTSELQDNFAHQYAELRQSKGITLDQASETMCDVSYFGTMLVYNGLVDGMVSGAAHSTADTVRPALEIIGIRPGVTTVSSVFLMCLPDRVLAYGDCAVVPEPTAEQLADIAISSARTAAQFGIEPRVAMLSYSTGDSASGSDVDKVRAATELVRQRAGDLLVDGPIQYDAAADPSVAATKASDSAVAGRATVLIFPDLDTGNNLYKAVQRGAGVVAIGPVLQGLNKPVNDLSRGAGVDDIVNSVAVGAVRAQDTHG